MMLDQELARVRRFRELLQAAVPPLRAIPEALGGLTICDGFLRFFSSGGPSDLESWNRVSLWKYAWGGTAARITAFAEDRFGNQFGLVPEHDTVFLWSHEDGQYIDSELDAAALLEVIERHDLDWIKFYQDGTLDVFRKHVRPIPDEHHLHWTQPLILGGAVTTDNVSTVERVKHLIGHGQIWLQLHQSNPGAEIIFRR